MRKLVLAAAAVCVAGSAFAETDYSASTGEDSATVRLVFIQEDYCGIAPLGDAGAASLTDAKFEASFRIFCNVEFNLAAEQGSEMVLQENVTFVPPYVDRFDLADTVSNIGTQLAGGGASALPEDEDYADFKGGNGMYAAQDKDIVVEVVPQVGAEELKLVGGTYVGTVTINMTWDDIEGYIPTAPEGAGD